MKILYLEDNPQDAFLAKHILESVAPQMLLEVVHTVKDAIGALEAPPKPFDLVLTDLNLPDGSGIDVLNHIRSRSIPVAVVVVTGQSDEETVVAALKAGADDYVVKREDYLERMPNTLERALARYRAETALHSRSLRVLYAEYNQSDIDLTRRHMQQHAGHILLDIVSSTDAILSRLSKPEVRDSYDVLMLDYTLPGLNSLELLKEIGEQPGQKLPVVLIADHGSEDIAIQATRMGAADYVVKTPGYLVKLPLVIENAFHRTELAREHAALRAAETRYRDLVEKNPGVIYVDTPGHPSTTLYISQQILKITGYSAEDWLNDPGLWDHLIHPDDLPSVLALQEKCEKTGEPFHIEYRFVRPDGEVIWVNDEAVLIIDPQGNPLYWQGLLVDITAARKSDDALKRRDAILDALGLAAESLLKAPWESAIQQVLVELGQAAGASRSYIYQVHQDPQGRWLANLTHEWDAPGVDRVLGHIDRENVDMVAQGMGNWVDEMLSKQHVAGLVGEMGKADLAIFQPAGVLSLVCVPIFVRQNWWGVIGFDDCLTPREWYAAEIEAIRTAANILGAAIQRLEDEKALKRQLDEMMVIQAVTEAGTESATIDELLEKVTRTIGASLFTNNCGFLLLDESENALIHHTSYQGGHEPGASVERIALGEGITGRAFVTASPQIVRDVRTDPQYVARAGDVRSEICAPLRVGEQVIGVLNAESRDEYYSDEDLRLLSTIAGQVSTAAEKIKLLENEHRRLEESEILLQTAAIISSSLDLEVVLETILNSVKRVVPYTSAAVMLIEPDGSLLTVAARGFPDNHVLMGRRFENPSPLLQEVRRLRQPVISEDVTRDGLLTDWGHDTSYIRGWLGIPLITRDEVIGYITLDNEQPGAYSNTHAVVAQMLAYQAAEAISNAKLFEETRQRLHELEIVNALSIKLRSVQGVESIVELVLDELISSLGLTAASIWLYSQQDDQLRLASTRGWLGNLFAQRVMPRDGLLGSIFRAEAVYHIANFDSEVLPDQIVHLQPGQIGLGFPLRTSGEGIGVMVLAAEQIHQFGPEVSDLLVILAEMTANAIHRAQLHQRTQEQLHRLTTLRDVDLAISSSHDLGVTLNIIINHTVEQLKVDAASVLMYDPLMQVLTYAAGFGFRSSAISSARSRLGQGYAGTVVLKREMVKITEVDRNALGALAGEGFASYFGVPLLAKGQVKGVLEVFLRTPFSPTTDWLEFLEAMAGQTAIAIESAQLFQNLQQTNRDLEVAYDTTLEGWGKALELRDEETEGHTQRVTQLTLLLARRMGVPDEEQVHIRRGSLLHDIGKMGVPDEILRKPAKLTDEEWIKMRRHVQHAYDLLAPISYLRKAMVIPYCHHEKWDGTGYPRGLKGDEIPLSARIFAVVDVWDALRSDRPYRLKWPREKVIEYIKGQSGAHFDPAVVKVFVGMVEEGEFDWPGRD